MFRVSEDLHLFLVTPKFLDAAKCLRDVVTKSKTSTFAVFLRRMNL